jgi:hypothetical protein
MSKYDGLLENLGLIIDDLLFTQNPTKKVKELKKKRNWPGMPTSPYSVGIFLILLANGALFCHRAAYFRHFPMLDGFTPNPFYLLSRACGKIHSIQYSPLIRATQGEQFC